LTREKRPCLLCGKEVPPWVARRREKNICNDCWWGRLGGYYNFQRLSQAEKTRRWEELVDEVERAETREAMQRKFRRTGVEDRPQTSLEDYSGGNAVSN
jgi:hypothetical protein